MLELADEADSKSVGLITRAGSTPATGTTPNGSQTLDITGFAGFSLCFAALFEIKDTVSVPFQIAAGVIVPA